MIQPAPARRRVRVPRLGLALGLGAIAALGVYLYVGTVQQQVEQAQREVQQAAQKAVPRTPVLVAKVNVPARQPLLPEFFEIREIPQESVVSTALRSTEGLTGKVLTTPLAAGEQVLSNRLIDPNQPEINKFSEMIPPGKRAMAVQFSESIGTAGFIVPGDFVDVLALFKAAVLGKDQSMILLQDVQVLAVAQSTSPDQLLRQGQQAGTPQAKPALSGPQQAALGTPTAVPVPVSPAGARLVTLAVSPEAAERLALAEVHGSLRYIARPPTERDQSAILPADLSTLLSPIQAASAAIVATEIGPTNVKVGDTLTVKITVRNTSDKPLQTQGPQPGFTYVQGQTYFSQQFASEPGKWRVAVGSAGLDATELPYRWGMGGDLAPGASTTVTGQIKVTQDFKGTNFWVAIVEEPAKVVQTGVGMTLVTSAAENLAVVAVDSANVRSGPSIASSVVAQIPYGTQLQITGNSADWFRVRLPDNREGWVAAGWIVTAGR